MLFVEYRGTGAEVWDQAAVVASHLKTYGQTSAWLICSAFLPWNLPVMAQPAVSTQLSQLLISLCSPRSSRFSFPRSPPTLPPSVFAVTTSDLDPLDVTHAAASLTSSFKTKAVTDRHG